MEKNRVGTEGGENLDDKVDIKIQKISDSNLKNRASRELVEMWRSGSQDAARVLLARYAIGGLAFYLLTGQSPHDSSLLLDTVADEDLIVPNAPVTPAESKLVAVAKFAMKKAISSRPHSVTELFPLLVD